MGAGGQTRTIQKLQKALLYSGEIVIINTSQFWSADKHKVVTKYQDPDDDNRSNMVELFASCSQIQITLFLRDWLFIDRGEEIPRDNAIWEEAKERYFEEHGGADDIWLRLVKQR